MTTIEAIVSELKESIDYRCRPELDDIDAANILACIESLTAERAALAQENKRMVEVLEKFGKHDRNCEAVTESGCPCCSCGLDEALATVKKKE